MVRIEAPLRLRWANAYAAQSQSDFRVYRKLLADPEVEECHRLHYLQMACEKIAKAYRLRDMKTPLDVEMTSHIAFSKFITNLLMSPRIRERYISHDEKLTYIVRLGQRMAREVERLAPAVDRDNFPTNTEYPWTIGNTVFIPCRYRYSNMTTLTEPNGRTFLKIIQAAIENFDEISIS